MFPTLCFAGFIWFQMQIEVEETRVLTSMESFLYANLEALGAQLKQNFAGPLVRGRQCRRRWG